MQPTTITSLVNLVCAKGTVYQADLKAFDLVAIITNARQLANCGLALRYVDTRKGYALSSTVNR